MAGLPGTDKRRDFPAADEPCSCRTITTRRLVALKDQKGLARGVSGERR